MATRVFAVCVGPDWVELRVSSGPVLRRIKTLRVRTKRHPCYLFRAQTIVGGEPLVLIPMASYLHATQDVPGLPVINVRSIPREIKGATKDFVQDKKWGMAHFQGACYV